MDQFEELVEVFSTNDPNEAEVLRVALEGEGMRCEISGKGQAGFTGIFDVKLLVRASDSERARAYLESHKDT